MVMKNMKTNIQDTCQLIQTRRMSLDFLLSYSKSLQISKIMGRHFELHLN